MNENPRGFWRGNMTELMIELDRIAVKLRLDTRTDDWPKGNNKISIRLEQHKGLFRNMGIEISRIGRTSNNRLYEIRRITESGDTTQK